MDLRKRKAIGDDWLPKALVLVGNYVRRIEEPFLTGNPDNVQRPLYAAITASRNDA